MKACFIAVLIAVAGFALAPPKGDVARGRIVFEQNCQDCHDAYSQDVITGPGLKGLKDGKLPSGKAATHDKILDIINSGPAEMTSFKDRLTEQEKEDVVAFAMTL
ncbi:MAG: c-type cytochrome [Terriglobia bacterium]